jgi:transposase
MVAEVRGDYPTEDAAMTAVAEKLGIGSRETLRKWVRQDQIDNGQRSGTTTEESAQLKALKKENAELRRANEIFKAAASFFAAELCATKRDVDREAVKDRIHWAVAAA